MDELPLSIQDALEALIAEMQDCEMKKLRTKVEVSGDEYTISIKLSE